MRILLIFCLIIVVATTAYDSPFDDECETLSWPPRPDRIVPTHVVNLDLPPQERWHDIVTTYKSQIRNLISYIKSFVIEFNPKFQKLIELVDKDLGKLVSTFPDPYGAELIGVANSADLPLGEIVLYNIFYEIFTVCTSIVSQDSNGHIIHARNLDFGLFLGWDTKNNTWIISELLRPLTINVNFTRGGQLQYITTGFAGFIGVMTGVKPGAFSITMNERFEVKGGYIGLFEWIIGIDRKQSWVTFLPRDLLEKSAETFDEALEQLSNRPLLAPCYYIIAGPKPYQGAVVTRDRPKAADVWKLDNNGTWFLAQTNYDHWEKPLFVDDRITPANKCMNKMGQDDSAFAGIFNVLSTKPVLNKLTVYTTLIDVSSGHIETYIQFAKIHVGQFKILACALILIYLNYSL